MTIYSIYRIRLAKETMSANMPTQKSRYLIMKKAINFMKILANLKNVRWTLSN